MAHAQQLILNALQTLLAAGGTVAGTRVLVDRVDPLQPTDLPAIVLQEDGETAEPFVVNGLERRTLQVQVHCVIAHTTTAAAQAREFGLAAEVLVANSAALALLATQGRRITSSRPTADGDTDRLLAARVQTWEFSYLVLPGAPDTIVT